MEYDVFLSYCRKDKSRMREVRKALNGAGLRVWANETLRPGSDAWRDDIEGHIVASAAVVLVASPNAREDPYVLHEMRLAHLSQKRVFPALIHGEWNEALPYMLSEADIHGYDLRDGLIDDLQASLATHLNLLIADTASPTYEEPASFSSTLRASMAALNKHIVSLTEEQFAIFNTLHYKKQVAIAGCAGSGKTLIAAEKAIRLDRAGLRTLVLCHSWYLAQYLRDLVSGTHIRVSDFTTWVNAIIGRTGDAYGSWTHYVEPTNADLTAAFDRIIEDGLNYDAIIVDEGQDFRGLWWTLIQAALVNEQESILYIFHDDNQALLPWRAQYPLADPTPLWISKNCRNTGEIFEMVRRVHPQLPETSTSMQGQGMVRQWTFASGDDRETVHEAILTALDEIPAERLVVLTTEPAPVTQSELHNLALESTAETRWQDIILRVIGPVRDLSSETLPTDDDVRLVREFTREHYFPNGKPYSESHRVRWRLSHGRLDLSHPFRDQPDKVRSFFLLENWAEGVPQPDVVRVRAEDTMEPGAIRLATVSSYKGLEADGVVLYVPAPFRGHRAELEANVYVGMSRARYLLHIVTERTMASRIPHIVGEGHS